MTIYIPPLFILDLWLVALQGTVSVTHSLSPDKASFTAEILPFPNKKKEGAK